MRLGRKRGAGAAGERLADLAFLTLVRDALEEQAPGVTAGARLRGNSLSSPDGWTVGVSPAGPGAGHSYEVLALPDVGIQPGAPLFRDWTVAVTGDPADAAAAWVQTAGACLLELLDRRGHFATHVRPSDDDGVPGWHTIASGAIAFGLEVAENQRLQAAVLDLNVLHRIADTFAADLESSYFNGIRVHYGGEPGRMEAEIQINGVRHAAASAAMTALGLPEPTPFTTVRYYVLLLPLSADTGEPEYAAVHRELDHAHGPACRCGNALDAEHPGYAIALPHLIAELSSAERAERVRVDTGAMMVADGIGNFLRVRLPIRLEDGRTLVCLAWVYLDAPVIEEVVRRVRSRELAGHRFEGLFCNAVEPWGEGVLRAPVVLVGRPAEADAVGVCEIVESSHPLMTTVLEQRWPAAVVLGGRDGG
jgi:Family of unknown function (DUF6348)/Uncharacterized protein conserved in bacteria (DUF2199)